MTSFYSRLLPRYSAKPPNGWRYPLVGGMRQRYFDGTNFKPNKRLENAQTPTSRVHAVLGGDWILQSGIADKALLMLPEISVLVCPSHQLLHI